MSRPVRLLLTATRVWLPIAIGVAGVAGIVIGHGHTPAAGAGVGLVSNRERDQEEEAREYFDRTGRWPDEDAP